MAFSVFKAEIDTLSHQAHVVLIDGTGTGPSRLITVKFPYALPLNNAIERGALAEIARHVLLEAARQIEPTPAKAV